MERFNVCQFFQDGTYEYVRRDVAADNAIEAFKHYTSSMAVKMGLVKRVIITDMLDCINAEWIADKGLVYPKKEEINNGR